MALFLEIVLFFLFIGLVIFDYRQRFFLMEQRIDFVERMLSKFRTEKILEELHRMPRPEHEKEEEERYDEDWDDNK